YIARKNFAKVTVKLITAKTADDGKYSFSGGSALDGKKVISPASKSTPLGEKDTMVFESNKTAAKDKFTREIIKEAFAKLIATDELFKGKVGTNHNQKDKYGFFLKPAPAANSGDYIKSLEKLTENDSNEAFKDEQAVKTGELTIYLAEFVNPA
ncbi:MAG: hypothetical protein ACTTI3_07260, partial [Treponema sp.]